jgi:hypothetical protein
MDLKFLQLSNKEHHQDVFFDRTKLRLSNISSLVGPSFRFETPNTRSKMPDDHPIHPGHGHYPARSAAALGTCPSGKAYFVCAKGPFTGCCSNDPCSLGHCADYPFDASWKSSTATETIGSYTTTVTMTRSSIATSGTVTSTLSPSEGDSPLVSSIISEISAISSITSSHSSDGSSVTGKPSAASNTYLSSSTTSVFLSVSTSTSTSSSTPHAGTVAGIALGTAGAIALLIVLCCICYRWRKKTSVSSSKNEDKVLKAQLKEAAKIQAERNKALRALENRRTGVGAEGVWASSPRHSTGWPGIRRDG